MLRKGNCMIIAGLAVLLFMEGCTWPLREKKEIFSYEDTLQEAWVDVITAPEWMENFHKSGNSENTLYMIQKGIILDVEVVDEPDLSRQVFVGPDGTFDYPMIGEIQVAGMTVPAFKENLTTKLQKYVRDPVVLVNATTAGSESSSLEMGRIYVLGQTGGGYRSVTGSRGGNTSNAGGSVVGSTGAETFIDIITAVGGLGENADWNSIGIIRKRPNDKPLIIMVNYERLVKYADLAQNVPVFANDIIYIPFQSDYTGNRFMEHWDLVFKYLNDIVSLSDITNTMTGDDFF